MLVSRSERRSGFARRPVCRPATRERRPPWRGRRISGLAGSDGRVETVERAHVLTAEVDVHEWRDAAVLEDLRAERGVAGREVLEQLPDRRPLCLHLPGAADLAAKRGRDAYRGHEATPRPARLQNST